VPKQCLFCPNPVDSAEHLFSKWIIKDLENAPPIRVSIGKTPSTWVASPEIKIPSVCKPCNNEWMGNLETASKGQLHAMINDDPCWLTKKDQVKLARWVLMKAMVIDSINPQRPLFYLNAERTQVKSATIPVGTLVWLGRLSSHNFHAGGTDIWGDLDEIPKGFQGNVTTMVMGHLVTQVLSGHVLSQLASTRIQVGLAPKVGAWNVNLLDIFPTTEQLRWPPSVSFTLQGADSIRELVNRWKIGENIG
jgi:hypothetical protein